ncbi:unnamed protein product [Polarella glacialis]|uniref:Uncharacterized protein n=1 Tax=Polarella glacialis TaxID=89957 RepID=A0A813GH13_POLGL|nr:unnamed protein product [Polarella glacialis]
MPPEKRWRASVAAPSSSEATVEDWKTHPRLQKHVLRFLGSPDLGRVLLRYAAQAQQLDREKLLRIAVHVGAWVALLPWEQAAASPSGGEDASQPSPVQLLAQILRLRGRAKITDWLQGVLHLVALRLQDVRQNVQGQAAVPWRELRRSMPKTIWRDLRTRRPAIPACSESKEQQEPADQVPRLKRKPPLEQPEPAGAETESDMLHQSGGLAFDALLPSEMHQEISELGNQKAVRRFYRNAAAFSNANLEERARQVDGLEEQLVKAVSSESWDQLCSLVKEAAAALAGPRQKAALNEAAVPMTEEAKERLQANLQSKLRKLICKGLSYLDLSDAGTAWQLKPALSFMKLLIERFKVRGQLDEARAAKQWLLLQGVLTAEATKEAEPNLENYSKIPLTEASHGRVVIQTTTTVGGVYMPSRKIQDNPLVRKTVHDVLVTCNKCGVELRSSWVFDYRGKLRTVVPNNGHLPCGGRYVSVTGILLIRDTPVILDVCHHNNRRSKCVKCGGSDICIHQKQQFHCPLCLAAGCKYKKKVAQSEVREKTSELHGIAAGASFVVHEAVDRALQDSKPAGGGPGCEAVAAARGASHSRSDDSTNTKLESSQPEGSVKRSGVLKTTKDGVYTPSQKIQNDIHVRNTADDVILSCNKCGIELRSSWVFDYLGKVQTLVPNKGHSACGGKYAPRSAKVSIKLDDITHLDMCPHGSQRSKCVTCEGSEICAHKKRRYQCPLCFAIGFNKKHKARSDKGQDTLLVCCS